MLKIPLEKIDLNDKNNFAEIFFKKFEIFEYKENPNKDLHLVDDYIFISERSGKLLIGRLTHENKKCKDIFFIPINIFGLVHEEQAKFNKLKQIIKNKESDVTNLEYSYENDQLFVVNQNAEIIIFKNIVRNVAKTIN